MNSMRVLTGIGGGEDKAECQEKLIKICVHTDTSWQHEEAEERHEQRSVAGVHVKQLQSTARGRDPADRLKERAYSYNSALLNDGSQSIPPGTRWQQASRSPRILWHRRCSVFTSSRLIINSSPCWRRPGAASAIWPETEMDNEVGDSNLLIQCAAENLCICYMSMDMDMFRTMRPNLSRRSFTWTRYRWN